MDVHARLLQSVAPLVLPQCLIDHNLSPDPLEYAEYLRNSARPYVGFEFERFQVIEHRHPAGTLNDDGSSAPLIEWSFVLTAVLKAFLEASLDQEDTELYILHRLNAYRLELDDMVGDFAPELGPKPPGVYACGGLEHVSFRICVFGEDNLDEARLWLARVFIPHWVERFTRNPQGLPQHFRELELVEERWM